MSNIKLFKPMLMTVVASVAMSACTFYARDADEYRRVTRELVDTRGGDIKDCYEVVLETNEAVSGSVVVNFTVEKKTGKLTQLAWDKNRTSVSEGLATCVVGALEGLELDPQDQRDGVATFSYTFRNNTPPAS